MYMRQALVAIAVFAVAQAASAQEYFDFDSIPGAPARPAMQFDLNPMLLGLAGEFARTEDPEAADLLSGIDGVRMRLYRSLEDIGQVVAFIDDVAARLEQDNWQHVLSVQDDANIRVYIRGDKDFITGLTAMAVSDEGAIFLNAIGSISSETLAESMAQLQSGESFGSLGQLMALTEMTTALNEAE